MGRRNKISEIHQKMASTFVYWKTRATKKSWTLIKIWKFVEEKLVIVGEGSQEERLKNLVADLDIKKIKFIPYTDNVGNILCHLKDKFFAL